MPSVTVQINGKNYRMACDEGQEAHLNTLAETFDGYVEQLKGSFGEIGDQRLTVMAGVMVTDELLELKKRVSKLEKDMGSLEAKREKVIGQKGEVEDEVSALLLGVTERIDALAAKMKAG